MGIIAAGHHGVSLVEISLTALPGQIPGQAVEQRLFIESPLGRWLMIAASLGAALYFGYRVIRALVSQRVRIGGTYFDRKDKPKDYWYEVGIHAIVGVILLGAAVYSFLKWF